MICLHLTCGEACVLIPKLPLMMISLRCMGITDYFALLVAAEMCLSLIIIILFIHFLHFYLNRVTGHV